MKILLAAILATAGFLAVPSTAQAGLHIHVGYSDHYVSGRASCGCPIYTKRVCRGYDRCNRPIYGYYRQPFRCGCKSRARARSCSPSPRYYDPRRYGVARPHYYHHRGTGYGHARSRHYQSRGCR